MHTVHGLLLAAMIAAPSCVSRQPDDAIVPAGSVRVYVNNTSKETLRLFALVGGIRTWIGTIMPMTEGVAFIPESLLHSSSLMRVQASAVAGETFVTPLLALAPGAALRLDVDAEIDLTTWTRLK
jgi:hypothetical protein